MGLLDKGRAWSNRLTKSESVYIRYVRDGKEIATFLARPTPPANMVTEKSSMVISRDERDFLVSREDMKDYAGRYFLPEKGDRIVQNLYGTEKTFIVGTKNNEDHFVFRDGGETSIRIHAVLWDEQDRYE